MSYEGVRRIEHLYFLRHSGTSPFSLVRSLSLVSDELKVPLELPVSHRTLELPPLPIARGHKVVNKLVPKDLPRNRVLGSHGSGGIQQVGWQLLQLH